MSNLPELKTVFSALSDETIDKLDKSIVRRGIVGTLLVQDFYNDHTRLCVKMARLTFPDLPLLEEALDIASRVFFSGLEYRPHNDPYFEQIADEHQAHLNACHTLGIALSAAPSVDGTLEYLLPGTNTPYSVVNEFQRKRTLTQVTAHHWNDTELNVQLDDLEAMEIVDKARERFRNLGDGVLGIVDERNNKDIIMVPINPLHEYLMWVADIQAIITKTEVEPEEGEHGNASTA